MSDREPPLKQEGSDEIKRYDTKIRDQFKKGVIPLEIVDLLHFMRQSEMTMPQIFKTSQRGIIPRGEFESSLREAGF